MYSTELREDVIWIGNRLSHGSVVFFQSGLGEVN